MIIPIAHNKNFLSAFIDILQKWDICPSTIDINAKTFVRFKSLKACERSHSKCCYYFVYPNQLGAYFGCWKRNIKVSWIIKGFNDFTSQERIYHHVAWKMIKDDMEEKQKISAVRIKDILKKSKEASDTHPYILRKKIKPYFCKQIDDKLIVPIYSIYGHVQSLQIIFSNGDKLFQEGSSTKGGYLPLGNKITNRIRMCEGYATGCTIYEATNDPTFICFSANNLLNVGEWIRKKYPEIEIIICGDDDKKNESRTGKNAGLFFALKTAESINAKTVFPDFENYATNDNYSDFNDLLCLAGIEAVENQLTT